MQRLLASLIIFFCFYQGNLLAEMPALVQDAFNAMEKADKKEWTFIRTTIEGKNKKIERYSAANDPVWTRVNPSPDNVLVEKAQKNKPKSKNKDDEGSDSKFIDLADPESWKLISESDIEAVYEFKPMGDDEGGKKIMQFMTGTLHIDKINPHVKSFSLKADRPFKPAAIAKVLKMHVVIEFEDMGGGNYFPVKESEDVVVRIFGIKKAQKAEKIYSEFKRVGTK